MNLLSSLTKGSVLSYYHPCKDTEVLSFTKINHLFESSPSTRPIVAESNPRDRTTVRFVVLADLRQTLPTVDDFLYVMMSTEVPLSYDPLIPFSSTIRTLVLLKGAVS